MQAKLKDLTQTIAELAADELLSMSLIDKNDLDTVISVIEEEARIRLLITDVFKVSKD